MLFLPAAALCCLCSALAAMATQLLQEDLTWTRRVGERVSFSCRGTEQCDSRRPYVWWYQKRDTETFTVILDINRNDGEIDRDFNHPQEDDFSAVNKQNGCELQIQSVKLNHSATYYCFCQKRGSYYMFGSGTKLFVVDQQVVKPVVSVSPAAPRAHLEGKSSLLCLVSAMFPPLVRISWKRRKENGPLEELPPAEGEQLELRESGCTAAILLLRQQESSTYKYHCYVFIVEAPTEQEVPAPAASCPPEREPADLPALQQADWSFQSQCRVKLLCLLYTVLIVKSLVFCCGIVLLMIIRNKGPSTNCTHAD
ncbi:immunoglobulin lambda-1 light chain-like [Centropristis striata]|uniref:immunoglobulin lambda-1 light chain-like n=1 Tax=Centropristis striata TaxID=184440 RepID=UPI0027E0B7DC|nr:immunoglobulin lambda-1 light chain-like [Centropristis striata]